MIRTARRGRARGQTGVSQRAPVGSQRSRPPDTPRRTIGTAPPGSAGVSPACYPLGYRSVSLRCGSPPLLPVEIAWARPKQSHGAVAVRSGSRRWVRLYQDLCGRDARAPGGLSPMTGSHQGHHIAKALWRRLWLKQVHRSSGLFVFIRVHSWFVFINDYLKQNLFHPRMIRPVVGGGGPTYLKQTLAPGGWKPVHSQAWVDF